MRDKLCAFRTVVLLKEEPLTVIFAVKTEMFYDSLNIKCSRLDLSEKITSASAVELSSA